MHDVKVTTLAEAISTQHALQIGSYGKDPAELKEAELMEFLRWNVLACEDELHEALGETGWKPWASSNHLNAEAFHGELVDAFHFFMNLCIASGLSAEALLEGYEVKAKRNAARMAAGYDGVDGKCPKCRRALDDPAVVCSFNKDSRRGFCQDFGAFSS